MIALAVFTTGFGGVARYVFSLGMEMSKRGNSSLLLLRDAALVKEAESLGLKVEHLPKARKYDFIFLLRVCRLLRRVKSSIVHTNETLSAFSVTLCQIFARKDTCHIVSVHSLPDIDYSYGKWKLWFHNQMDHYAWKKASGIIVMTDRLRKHLVSLGIAPEKIYLIYNGVDTQRFTPFRAAWLRRDSPSPIRIGSAGRLSREKGFDILIQAVGELVHSNPGLDFEVVIMGEGVEKRKLDDLRKKRGVEKLVSLVGFERDIGKALSSLDIFVLPSRMESFPMVLLEAGAIGIPIIASRVGGIPEMIVDGKEGLLVSPESPRELAKAILRLIKDPDKRRSLGEAFHRKVIKTFNLQKMVSETLSFYRSVLERTGCNGTNNEKEHP